MVLEVVECNMVPAIGNSITWQTNVDRSVRLCRKEKQKVYPCKNGFVWIILIIVFNMSGLSYSEQMSIIYSSNFPTDWLNNELYHFVDIHLHQLSVMSYETEITS